ncbi:PAS domain-containing protein [Emticicia sp. CRIBPO]|uniref:PAS domain-containing protein n=1 Tax=Emticicia sp. CRIBPO TaxID=2683258 RepID=UPI0014137513|nr:PAS domain-containing protein [Emticicia sp. CRIBPO]NBA88097.1 PAS domain-containing protein [Emticicia sp. CRIBPO]
MIHYSENYAEMLRSNYASAKSGPLICWDILLMDEQEEVMKELLFLEGLRIRFNWQSDIDFESLIRNKYTLVITNLSQEIIWTSAGFYTMTGYKMEEVLGKRPSFLQGENTNSKTKQIMADKIRNFEPAEARLVNYRKDGKPYLCYVKIQAIRNQAGNYSHFFAIEKNIREKD